MGNTKMIYRDVKESEDGVKGGEMRALVMAALHCDFDQALQLCAKSDNLTKRFNEDSTNMTHLMNLLKQFKTLHGASVNSQNE